jgi:hypothetical protein
VVLCHHLVELAWTPFARCYLVSHMDVVRSGVGEGRSAT